MVIIFLAGCTQQKPVTKSNYSTLEEYKNSINYSCKKNTDCEIKNVSNCCGGYPECVNKNSIADPDFVKKACIDEKLGGICGFPSIENCRCNNNKCEGF